MLRSGCGQSRSVQCSLSVEALPVWAVPWRHGHASSLGGRHASRRRVRSGCSCSSRSTTRARSKQFVLSGLALTALRAIIGRIRPSKSRSDLIIRGTTICTPKWPRFEPDTLPRPSRGHIRRIGVGSEPLCALACRLNPLGAFKRVHFCIRP